MQRSLNKCASFPHKNKNGRGRNKREKNKVYRRPEMLRYQCSVNAMVLDTSSSCVYGHCNLQAIYIQSSYTLCSLFADASKKKDHSERSRMISELRVLRRNGAKHLNQEHSQNSAQQSFPEFRCSIRN